MVMLSRQLLVSWHFQSWATLGDFCFKNVLNKLVGPTAHEPDTYCRILHTGVHDFHCGFNFSNYNSTNILEHPWVL